MKRITGTTILLAALAVPGWSSVQGPWDQAMPCETYPGQTCEDDIGDSCQDQAFHIYNHKLDACSWGTDAVSELCRQIATMEYHQTLAACP